MRTPLRFLLAAAVSGVCASAGAATTASAGTTAGPDASPRAQQHDTMRRRLFESIDTNHDGVISRDEYRAFVDGRFAKLDGNGDGTVDAAEIADSAAARQRLQRRADRFVRRFDASGTGKVSRADFEAKAMQRFDRIADGADTITPDQLGGAGHRGWRHPHDEEPRQQQ